MNRKSTISLLLAFGFLLGVHDGFIALWKDGCAEPQVFPYRASLLPDADRRLLEQGVRVEDSSELEQLLEDYLS